MSEKSDTISSNIFYVGGSFHFRKTAIKKILDGISEYDLFVCESKEEPLAKYASKVHYCDLLSENTERKKVIIFKQIPDGKTAKKTNTEFIKMLDSVTQDCIVIIDNMSKRKKTIFNHLKKVGVIWDFDRYLDTPEATKWILDRLEKYKKTISSKAVEYIIQSVGKEFKSGVDVDRLYMFVLKLVSYMGRKKEIDDSEVYRVVDRFDGDVFEDISAALAAKNFTKCHILLYRIMSGNKTEKFFKIVHLLRWKFRLLLLIKDQMHHGKTAQEVIKELQDNFHKFKKTGANLQSSYEVEIEKGEPKPYYTSGALTYAAKGFWGNAPEVDNYSRKDLYKAVDCLHEILLCIRDRRADKNEIMNLMNHFFMTMCDLGDYKGMKKNRSLIYYD